MERETLLDIASELMETLNKKRLTPVCAKAVVEILKKSVENDIDEAVNEFMEKTGTFRGKVPTIKDFMN
ncbi:MAG: hypothetical protein LIO94_07860 [Clostridiales bacterium]|nr:hypothetical protein [Clostridiales bacterium]